MSIEERMERRFHEVETQLEVRRHGNKQLIEGYAAVFDKRSSNLGGFVEVVRKSAFGKSLRESDVRALINHDPNRLLGRNQSGTLELATDSTGLHYRVSPPNTAYANDLVELMARRDISQSSFGFVTVQDTWAQTEDGYPERSLVEVRLLDVSVVTYPAYPDAVSGLARTAALSSLAKRANCEVGDLCDANAIRRAMRGEPVPDATIAAVRQAVSDQRIPSPNWTQRAELMAEMEKALREEQLHSVN